MLSSERFSAAASVNYLKIIKLMNDLLARRFPWRPVSALELASKQNIISRLSACERLETKVEMNMNGLGLELYGKSIRPRRNVFHTTPHDTYIPAVTTNTSANDPVVSRMYPVSKLAAMPAPTPSVLVSPRKAPAREGATSWRQGLTLVHFSAQPEPFLTQCTPYTLPPP